jgi:hypothetical protein
LSLIRARLIKEWPLEVTERSTEVAHGWGNGEAQGGSGNLGAANRSPSEHAFQPDERSRRREGQARLNRFKRIQIGFSGQTAELQSELARKITPKAT